MSATISFNSLFLAVLGLLFPAAVNAAPRDLLNRWNPGEPVAADTALLLQCFTASEIPDSVFLRMKGKSFKAECSVPRSELRYLTIPHYDGHGNILMGEMVCNKAIADDLLDIFSAAFRDRYPIERMVLIDEYDADDRKSMTANNTSCFNFRVVSGTKQLSNHARGLALDINPLYNPYVSRKRNGTLYVSPPDGRPYSDRKVSFPYKIDPADDLLYSLFISHGFSWGGAWRSMQDYQHFEKKIK